MSFARKDPLKEIFKDYDRGNFEDILETARAISGGNRRVVAAVDAALDDPKKYIKQNAKRFEERGIRLDDIPDGLDADELLMFAMLDELEIFDYVFEFNAEYERADFLWRLSRLKTYGLIKDAVGGLVLDEDGNVETWGKAINGALDGKAYICYIHIEGENYPLAIMTHETFEKIPLPFVVVM